MAASPFVLTLDPADFPAGDGPLAGLRLAIKDNFELAGTIAGSGHPLWAASRPPALDTAPLVDRLIRQGARPVGKTHMDELAYSLMGENAHYGTPLNPAAPERVPGGSSSGSASAVAQGLADIGLGSDTGGSVRLPASFCGLWGWRPTHGLLPAVGLQALAPSYDVPGFLTRDGATLSRVADAVLGGITEAVAKEAPRGPHRSIAPDDIWALAPDAAVPLARHRDGADRSALLPPALIAELQPVFGIVQGAEVAEVFGDWIRANNPEFGPGVRERFEAALRLHPEAIATARALRARIAAIIMDRLAPEGVMLVPTAPGAAPRLGSSGAQMELYRNRALSLLCLAGHAGLPQISVPLAEVEGAPVGLSLVGPRGSDRRLIGLARAIAEQSRPSTGSPVKTWHAD
ncbi:amidase [Jiella sp. MQZ9-1]|uniref:Amidase n=1 Tax=Jiella flava TaxID=2816857 RepID=A0A939FZ62_9HYPH|nr:amidase [Jiella flava]MBO0664275.1 amidase [Jiella flava]MCD2472802.1 amidase [Jiella flava]